MKTKDRAAYASIAQMGGNYVVTHYREGNSTSSRSHCSDQSFETYPDNTPLIDYRTADDRLFSFIMRHSIEETTHPNPMFDRPGERIPLAKWIEGVKEIGATVTTLGAYRAAKATSNQQTPAHHASL